MFNRGIVSLQIMLKLSKPSEMGQDTYKHVYEIHSNFNNQKIFNDCLKVKKKLTYILTKNEPGKLQHKTVKLTLRMWYWDIHDNAYVKNLFKVLIYVRAAKN